MVKFLHAERGQALIIMVCAFVGLLVVLGLAIDGGTVFLERRRMQNAADAAALAGTRLLAEAICGEPGADDAAIAAEVNHYAEINGVKDPDNNVVADYVDFEEGVLGHVGDGTIPAGATGISATVEISRPTYFVTLVGIDTAGASATALAMTGPPLMASGLRPFGVPLEVVGALGPGNEFTISFKHCKGDDPEDCPITDEEGAVIAQHRGWMNLNWVWNQGEGTDGWPRAVKKSASTNVLRAWMQNGWHGMLYADGEWSGGWRYGDFIHALPGARSDPVDEAPLETLIFVPIYDYIPQYEEIPPPKPDDATQGGGYYYHIVGFSGVRITDANQGDGTITMELVENIIGQGMPSPSEGYQSGGGSNGCKTRTMVVTLWR